jgi:hypothetical protein
VCEKVPPLGFTDPEHIAVSEDSRAVFPVANTCVMELQLPAKHQNDEKFSFFMKLWKALGFIN